MDLSAPNSRAAIHEAGHAVALLLRGLEFSTVYLHSGDAGRIAHPALVVRPEEWLFFLASGAAAERLFYGLAYIGCEHDIEMMLGIFRRIGYQGDDEAACLKCIYEAEKLLTPKRDLIQRIARALQQHQQLTYQQMKELL